MDIVFLDDATIPINFSFCEDYMRNFFIENKQTRYVYRDVIFSTSEVVHRRLLGGARKTRHQYDTPIIELENFLYSFIVEHRNLVLKRELALKKEEEERKERELYEREFRRKQAEALREAERLKRYRQERNIGKNDNPESESEAARIRKMLDERAQESRLGLLHSRLGSISGMSNSASDRSSLPNPGESLATVVAKTTHIFDTVDPKPRPKIVREKRVDVDRNKYEKVSKILKDPEHGWIICGPTGCGKSTVALLPLLRDKTKKTIIVEPTVANAANILQEFEVSIPNLVRNGVIKEGSMPPVYTDFSLKTASKTFSNLYVTTVACLLDFFRRTRKIPRADYWVIDEFHLPIQDMVTTVFLFKTLNVDAKYILVSATIPGVKVNAKIPADVSVRTDKSIKPEIPRVIKNSVLDPNRYKNEGDGSVAIVTPSVPMARTLAKRYKDLGHRVWVITRHTGIETYKSAVRDNKRRVYILEPGVEAGITLSMAVLISMGATSAIRYDGKVVLEETQPIDKVAEIQRASRGGRVKPTLYLKPPSSNDVKGNDDPAYYQANAAVELIALGVKSTLFQSYDFLKDFPKVASISQDLAKSAMSADSQRPLIAAYQYNSDGKKFKECGGEGEGFEKLASEELSLYYWKKGFFVAPIADFSDLNTDPTNFVNREGQLTGAKAMVATIPGLKEKATIKELIAMIKEDIVQYLPDLFRVLSRVFSRKESQNIGFSSMKPETARHPTIKDVVLDEDVASLLYAMSMQPGVDYTEILPDFTLNQEATIASASASYSLTYQGQTMHVGLPESFRLKDSFNIDTDKVRRRVKEELEEVLAVPLIRQHARERCVNLSNYVNRVSSEHKWFAENVY
uniref:Movement protein n=1 Tax=Uromyces fabae virus TaxID=3069272 RepID=A0AA51UA18_9VIRU|nr:movement protein [Uromyces fabae virus]